MLHICFFSMLKIRNIVFPVILWTLVSFLTDGETVRLLRPNLDVLCCLSSVRYEEGPVEPAGLVRLLCDNRSDEQGGVYPFSEPRKRSQACSRVSQRVSSFWQKLFVFAETHLFNSKKTAKRIKMNDENDLYLLDLQNQFLHVGKPNDRVICFISKGKSHPSRAN